MTVMLWTALPAPLTAATELRLHTARDRSDTPTTFPVTHNADGTWSADTGTTTGRYWPTLAGTDSTGAAATADLPYVDLPIDPTLVVSPEAVAVKAPNMKLPLDDDERDIILGAIQDAQADVEAYLGRPLTPLQYTQQHCWPYPNGWNLTAHGDDVMGQVLSTTAETDPATGAPTGYYTVVYTAGLDSKNDPQLAPIRRYVAAHAVNSPEFIQMWIRVTGAKGIVRTVSAEGQSITWEAPSLGGTETAMTRNRNAQPGTTPGSLPTIAILDRWRLNGRRVHQGRTHGGEWPYSSLWPDRAASVAGGYNDEAWY